MSELAAMSGVVLTCITAGYLYVYDLYRRRFFLYLAFAWATNGIYIAVERSVAVHDIPRDFACVAVLSVLSAITTTFFVTAIADIDAIRARARRTLATIGIAVATLTSVCAMWPPLSSWRTELLTSVVAVVGAFALFMLARAVHRRSLQEILELPRQRAAPVVTPDAIAVTDSGVTSISVENYFGAATSPMTAGALRSLRFAKTAFESSCIVYGAIQILYPFRSLIIELGPSYFTAIFWISFSAKVLHGTVVPALLLADFRTTAELLRTRSVAEELGVLTASIEHDIRSPLAVIVKEIETVRLKFQHEPWLTRKLAQIEGETRRIDAAAQVIPATRDLVEHFMENAVALNVVHIVRDAVSAIKKVDRTGNVRINFETTRSEILIRGDEPRLKQAFVNILNNGVEACRARLDKKPPVIDVNVRMAGGNDACLVSITDYGVGLSAEVAGKLGKPLFSTKTGHGGNRGIGLFIATRAFRLHGGEIRFESDGTSYTSAIITLPTGGR